MGVSVIYVILSLLAQLLPAAWMIREIVRAVTVPRGSKAEPACEKCGYSVTGLAALRCPECGTDLRATGIVTRAMEMRRRSSIGAAVTAWWFVWLWVSVYATLTLGRALWDNPATDGIWIAVTASLMITGGLVTWLIVRRRRRLLREFGADRPQPSDAPGAHNAGA